MSFLSAAAEVGMKVVLDRSSRGAKSAAPGATGILVARQRRRTYVPQFGIDRRTHIPGLYEEDGSWLVQMDIQTSSTKSSVQNTTDLVVAGEEFSIHPESLAAYENDLDENWRKPVVVDKTLPYSRQISHLNHWVRVADRPDAEAWELDEVIPYYGVLTDEKDPRCVVVGYMFSSTRDVYFYELRCYDETGRFLYDTLLAQTQVERIIRGNAWKAAHGEPTFFSTLDEQAMFAHGLGQIDEVRNPIPGLYAWTPDEFFEAVQQGTVDCLRPCSTPMEQNKVIEPLRYHDRVLGERLRLQTLDEFRPLLPKALP